MEEALQRHRRARIAQRFLSGEWGWSWIVLRLIDSATATGTRLWPDDAVAR